MGATNEFLAMESRRSDDKRDKISKPQAVANLECVIDTYDVKPIHPPKLLN